MTRRSWLILAVAIGGGLLALAVALWLLGRQEEGAGIVAAAVGTAALELARRRAAAARAHGEAVAAEHEERASEHEERASSLLEEALDDGQTSGELADWIRNER